ncbi:MAG: glycoside hydrolase family 15 protein [Bacillota bacterium]|nr:glycoside hydrolase family 15 protein [Bacillota bacterium]
MGKRKSINIQKSCSHIEYLQPICTEYNKKPYLVNGIIGNSSLLASLGENGQIYRLWWPNIDIPQHIDETKIGIFILGKVNHTIWLDDPNEQWSYNQYYIKDTNILVSTAEKTSLNVLIKSTTFAVPNKDLLVRNFEITNTGNKKTNLQFIHYTSLKIEENPLYNTTTFIAKEDSLAHYRDNYAFCISSPIKCSGYSTKDALKDAEHGSLSGGKVVLNSRGAISYFLSIEPNKTKELPLYFSCGHILEEAIYKMKEAKSQNYNEWLEITKREDLKFLEEGKQLSLEDEKIQMLYRRSLLVQKILYDKKSGCIVAAPEVDETYSRCGGYDYCWGRDGVYAARAFQIAGFLEFSRSFYLWTLTSQNEDGSWQQRHYHNGNLAPSWGFQIDEGGSILWGMWQYYEESEDSNFLNMVWEAVKKGAEFLVDFINTKNNLPKSSLDLWEEREGQHAYSSAAVYGGLLGAYNIAKELGHEELSFKWKAAADKIQKSIEEVFWNEKSQRYYRTINEEVSKEVYEAEIKTEDMGYKKEDKKGYISYYINYDPIVDSSLLGLVEPFQVFSPEAAKMQKTADSIQKMLWNQKVGGIKRYENDVYIGGNPWIVTTLWLALFRIKQKQYHKAKELLDWVVQHRTCLGLLSEQIDKQDGTPAWVIPLNWSHALFIIAVQLLETIT